MGSPHRKSTALGVKRLMFASHLLTLCESGQASSLFKTHHRLPIASQKSPENLGILIQAYKILCDLSLPLSPGLFPTMPDL